ncbi:iron-sulfur cluster repair protein YtfE [Algiphilus aromaticivorans]|uniref:iron-sulfur cluster repair protein YtfE n=1 Tax=Algiphilus aromaticivorans TaxID=382454 RepID=UPI0005C1F309|nr:iron-sulfur cluster repair protein YtfE [Algiphilus aromaticivorans]
MAQLQEQSLGELARTIPGATAVFHNYRLDFCCGGDKMLREAAQMRGVDPDEVVARLEDLLAAPPSAEHWEQASEAELIDHILVRYHDPLREQLPELQRLTRRVEKVHAAHPDCPAGLADVLAQMEEELEMHMRKEEEVLFPMLARRQHGAASQPVRVMRDEHDAHGEVLERIATLTNDMQPPERACNTWQALYAGLALLRHDLMEHIHLENNVLFRMGQTRAQPA